MLCVNGNTYIYNLYVPLFKSVQSKALPYENAFIKWKNPKDYV